VDDKDLIYEGIATPFYEAFHNSLLVADDKDLIYEGIATHKMRCHSSRHTFRRRQRPDLRRDCDTGLSLHCGAWRCQMTTKT